MGGCNCSKPTNENNVDVNKLDDQDNETMNNDKDPENPPPMGAEGILDYHDDMENRERELNNHKHNLDNKTGKELGKNTS
jgi:hypothetical protein